MNKKEKNKFELSSFEYEDGDVDISYWAENDGKWDINSISMSMSEKSQIETLEKFIKDLIKDKITKTLNIINEQERL